MMAVTKPSDNCDKIDTKMANVQQSGAHRHGEEWDEERLEEAEKTIKEMYIQVRGLRSIIPNLVASLTTKQASPEVLFKQLCGAALATNTEVKQFRELMEDPESRTLFEHVSQSQSQNPTGITPWRITEDPNWLKRN